MQKERQEWESNLCPSSTTGTQVQLITTRSLHLMRYIKLFKIRTIALHFLLSPEWCLLEARSTLKKSQIAWKVFSVQRWTLMSNASMPLAPASGWPPQLPVKSSLIIQHSVVTSNDKIIYSKKSKIFRKGIFADRASIMHITLKYIQKLSSERRGQQHTDVLSMEWWKSPVKSRITYVLNHI